MCNGGAETKLRSINVVKTSGLKNLQFDIFPVFKNRYSIPIRLVAKKKKM